MVSVKQILFDLGNVIIDIDFNRTIEAFRSLGWTEFGLGLDGNAEVFDLYETGKISTRAFLHQLNEQIPSATKLEIEQAWNALLIGIQPEVIGLLKSLQTKYSLFIYSNTNEMHLKWVMEYLKKNYNMTNWESQIFSGAYYSFEIGFRKPDENGFLHILKVNKIVAEETLFIDDFLPNINTAARLGFQVMHKRPVESLSQLMAKNRLIL